MNVVAMHKRDQLRDSIATGGHEYTIGCVRLLDAIINKSINDESLPKTVAELISLENALARIENNEFRH